jgi:hypothetical protein
VLFKNGLDRGQADALVGTRNQYAFDVASLLLFAGGGGDQYREKSPTPVFVAGKLSVHGTTKTMAKV